MRHRNTEDVICTATASAATPVDKFYDRKLRSNEFFLVSVVQYKIESNKSGMIKKNEYLI